MLRQTTTGIRRPYVPTLGDMQQRRAGLLGLLPQPDPEPTAESPRPPAPGPTADPNLQEAALHGLAGHVVRTIAPHSEAHPASILLQLLTVFGNILGRGPHCLVEATRHTLNLYLVLVGDSSKARKGTSWAQIARLFAEVDHSWLSTRVTRARLTPGGIVHALRDQDPPTDRRLLLLAEEFAPVLHTLKRGNGHLSPLLRCAWDNGDLPTLDLHHPHQATGTHISLIAHITQRELAQNLPRTEAQNGFANRCLWASVQRSNCLPEGGSLDPNEVSALARELRRALDWSASTPQILFRREPAARELWHDRYPTLSQLTPGLRGAATSRAEAQVLRLSAIYAALDSTAIIGLPHLRAALAVWDYCHSSAAILFGISTGDPIADRIREAIESSNGGLSKHHIRRLFHGHVESNRIDTALEKLVALGALSPQTEPTAGRPITRWSSTGEHEHNQTEDLEVQDETPEEA